MGPTGPTGDSGLSYTPLFQFNSTNNYNVLTAGQYCFDSGLSNLYVNVSTPDQINWITWLSSEGQTLINNFLITLVEISNPNNQANGLVLNSNIVNISGSIWRLASNWNSIGFPVSTHFSVFTAAIIGMNGNPGANGNGIAVSQIDPNGDLYLTYTDSSVVNVGHVVGATGPTGPGGGSTGPTGPGGGSTGPTGPAGNGNNMGNVLTVDAVNGNDSTASPGGTPYLTIEAAIVDALSGCAIWVLPGVYNLSAGITIPDGVSLRGMSVQVCTIQMRDVTQDVTVLLTMGNNTRVEDLTLSLHSAGHHDLIGIKFGGSTTSNSKIRTCVITVDNHLAGPSGSSNVYGVLCSGGNISPSTIFSTNALKGSTINVLSDGGGNKRGILVSSANVVTTRDLNVYVAAPPSNVSFEGSYVGVETNDTSDSLHRGSVQLRSTTVAAVKPTGPQDYTSSDILQTTPATITAPTYLASPGIQIGPGTDLVTKSAGGLGFSTYIYPTTLFYGCRGVITNIKTGFLWPGTQTFSTGGGNNPPIYPDTSIPPARYRVQQPLIVSGMMVTANKLINGNYITVTVCKNATAITPDGQTVMTITMTYTDLVSGTAFKRSFYNASVDFAAGDYISLYFTTNSTVLEDVVVQLDCF